MQTREDRPNQMFNNVLLFFFFSLSILQTSSLFLSHMYSLIVAVGSTKAGPQKCHRRRLWARKKRRAASHSTCAAYCKGSPTVHIHHLSTVWLGWRHTDAHTSNTKDCAQKGQIPKKLHSSNTLQWSRTQLLYVTHTHTHSISIIYIIIISSAHWAGLT